MKRLLCSAACAVVLTVVLGNTAFATTSLELVVNGVDTVYVSDNGLVQCTGPDCATAIYPIADGNAFVGSIALNGISIDGWLITTSSGGSNSPGCLPSGSGGPGCLNTSNINAVSTAGGSLTAYFESDGFTAEPGFTVGYSSTGVQTGHEASQTAYIGAGAVDLGAGVLAPAPVGAACGSTLNSLAPGVVATTTGCGAGGGTLELETAFITGPTGGGFNVNGNISAVPEPAAVVLFGTVLALVASGLRRRGGKLS